MIRRCNPSWLGRHGSRDLVSEAAGHIVCIAKKQRKMNAGVQFLLLESETPAQSLISMAALPTLIVPI